MYAHLFFLYCIIIFYLSDEITLTLNNRGSVVSMAYIPLVSPLASSCADVELKDESAEFSSKVTLETSKVGMSLPAVLPATKPPLGIKVLKGAKTPGTSAKTEFEKDDEPITSPQAFLKKYWYILLPILIMGLTGGGAAPGEEATKQGQAGGGQGQPASASAPIAASTPSSGGAKQRRGKRA
jgi:hypothetical protein